MKLLYISTLFISLASASFAQIGPIDFETGGHGATWTWTCFENDANPPLEIIANPDPSGLNTSSTVAKFTALQTGNPWAGCETSHGAGVGTFSITQSNKLIRIMVWKTKISPVGIKLVTSSSASLGQILVSNTQINKWEQLTFDFSAHIGGMVYDQLVVFPDFIARPADDIIYFDNIFGPAAFLGNEELSAPQVDIYPNPSNGIFEIQSETKFDKVEVVDMEGRIILSGSETTKIDLSNKSQGIYLIRLHANDMILSERIVVE